MAIASKASVFGSPKPVDKPVEKKMATVAELKAKLDDAGVEYSGKATKAELEALLPAETAEGAGQKSVEQIAHENQSEPVERPPRVRAVNKRDDIKITCMVELLDGNVVEDEIRIVNPGGCIIGTQRNNPAYVFDVLRSGLVATLGKNHIR